MPPEISSETGVQNGTKRQDLGRGLACPGSGGKAKTPILDSTLILRICIVGIIMLIGAFGSFEWALGQGFSDAAARTVAANVFVMVEIVCLFNCRSLTKSMFALGLFTNRWIVVGIATMVALQLVFTYVPLMNYLFHTAPIGWDAWWRILLTGVAAYVIVGIEKWLRRKWAQRRSVRLVDNT